ncbi:glycine oxidase ThiO [Hyphococcus flavus]|uniref:Glycine oxidase ThiO n=1 Tax=Hyphococcus flavus TaxID=1866326 RepID=A0AAE9ZE51_9PROT|nr:glycine oxidase ThiO [Hyphococcus flavus]WDI32030.1 glycine oxidase ThiO [Hyphococcus flavus]
MKKTFDIAIIGGGVIGMSLARALAARGAELALFDASVSVPPATNAAAGMLAPSFEHGHGGDCVSEALYHFGAHSLSLWPNYAAALEEETGQFIDFRGDGALGLAYTEAHANELGEQASRVAARGGDASIISGDDARAMEPALSKEILCALWAPNDAQVDPKRLLIALRAAVEKKAVQLFPEKVARIDVEDNGPRCTTFSGEAFSARKIVVAGGAVSGLVDAGLVFPVKGDATAIEIEEGFLTRVVRAPGAYLCPKAGGRLVIGASEEYGRDGDAVDAKAIETLQANAAIAAPQLKGSKELERWTGLRPGTPDAAPILGQTDTGVYLALGHYRNGVLHAPASAQEMTALILDGEASEYLESFNPSRFGKDKALQHG